MKNKKEIFDFFDARHKGVPLMIERRPLEVTALQMGAAAEEFYARIAEQYPKYLVMKDGSITNNIDIAREVRKIAMSIEFDTTRFQQDLEVFDNARRIIVQLENKNRMLIAKNYRDRLTMVIFYAVLSWTWAGYSICKVVW